MSGGVKNAPRGLEKNKRQTLRHDFLPASFGIG
jgi:hypothetical protein